MLTYLRDSYHPPFQSFLNLDMGKKMSNPQNMTFNFFQFQSFLNLDMGKKLYLHSSILCHALVSILLEFGYGEKGITVNRLLMVRNRFQSFLNLDMGKKREYSRKASHFGEVSILLEFGYGEKGWRPEIC